MNEEELKREVKGIWIPIEIWERKDLSVNEKVLYAEIDSYTSKSKDCFMSDEYISAFLGVNKTNANKTLSSLIKKGLVAKTRFDGRKRYVRAALSQTTDLTCQNRQTSFIYKEDNNTSNNNNLPVKSTNKEEEKELKEKEVADFVERIYKMYPTRCPKRNVSLGKSAKDKERIKRLLKIYKQEDIENVVKREVEEKYGKTYMQNFSTFLNNFPDPNSLFSEEKLENSSVQDDVLLKRFYDILSVNEEAHIYGINEYEFSILNEQQRNYIRNQYRSKMLEWIKSQNR